jgi:D-amino peptidase
MVQELDETYDAVLMVGYHAAAGSEGNALAHTLSLDPAAVVLNGAPASEFRIHALAAATVGVPVVFVSGDKALMDEVQALNPRIGRCAVKEGRGQSTVTLTPAAACRAIRDGVQAALSGDLDACLLPLEDRYVLDITYADPCKAERHRWYPGAEHVGARTVRLDCARYFDVLRALNYMT